MTLRALKAKCWKLFSLYIRRKNCDEGGTEYCYTCSRPFHWKELQAGHAIGGRHNSVLFDEEIVRPQCPSCNIFKRGNYQEFITRLIKENGMDWWEAKLVESRKTVKYTKADLEEKIEYYKKKLEELK